MKKPIIIAIDGYSSSGKSTMARALARRLGYRYIDSGAMYRAVTLYALENNLIDTNGNVDTDGIVNALDSIKIDFHLSADGTQHTTLNGRDVEADIRTMPVSSNVSTVSAIPQLRHRLVLWQQEFGKGKGIVMDGRDIGTIVFPDAELKIFVNAPAETRAHRRFIELEAKGIAVDFDEILANIRHRDLLDTTRAESPLRRAEDAIDLDNTLMTIEEQDAWLDEQVNLKLGR